jgi:Fe-S cluster biogenesis protein NfuA
MDRVNAEVERIRPAIQEHGGDVKVVSVDDNGVVAVELKGACVGCPSATMTLKMGIERLLRERVPGVTEVVPV